MNINQSEILKGIITTNQSPALLSVWDAKQFCPQAELTSTVLRGMYTYMVHSDSIEKFLKQNITHIYIDPQIDKHRQGGEATLIRLHTIVVQCIIR